MYKDRLRLYEPPELSPLVAMLEQDRVDALMGYRDWVATLDAYPPTAAQISPDDIEHLSRCNPALYRFLKTIPPVEFVSMVPAITQIFETVIQAKWVAQFDHEFAVYLQTAIPQLDLVPDLLQLDRIFQRLYPRYIERKSELLSISALRSGKNSCVGGALLIDSWARGLGQETVFFVLPKHQIYSDGNHHVLVGIQDPHYPDHLTSRDWEHIFEQTFAGIDNQPATLAHYFQGHLLTFSRPDTTPIDQWSRKNGYWLKAVPEVATANYPRFFQTDREGMLLYTLGYNR